MQDLFFNTYSDYISYQLEYWRNRGFPDYDKSEYNLKYELKSLYDFDETAIVKNDTIGQTMHGLGLLWTYFPHWKEITYSNDKTSLLDKWDDDKKLKELIEKTYRWEKLYGNGYITVNRLRQNAKVYMNKQTVSNFRPTVAKYIYNTYGNSGTVYDMSSGFGGRLFGFLASSCKKYIGVDPSLKTYNGLIELANDYKYINKEIVINNIGSENYMPNDNVDLCFTSPPYFDTEIYSTEITQACNAYKTKEDYISKFMIPSYKNAFNCLNIDGYMVINIANTKKTNYLESETMKILESFGMVKEKQMYMELSSIAGDGVKYEPIFIYKKETI